MKNILLILAFLFAVPAFAGSREIINPDLNGDIKVIVNKAGTPTTVMTYVGSTGTVSYGESGSSAEQTINAGSIGIRAPATVSALTRYYVNEVEKASTGAVGTSGQGVSGSTADNLFLRGTGIIFSGDFGTSNHGTISSGGAWVVGSTTTNSTGVRMQVEDGGATNKGPTLFLRSSYAAAGTQAILALGVDNAVDRFSTDVSGIRGQDGGQLDFIRGDGATGYTTNGSISSNGNLTIPSGSMSTGRGSGTISSGSPLNTIFTAGTSTIHLVTATIFAGAAIGGRTHNLVQVSSGGTVAITPIGTDSTLSLSSSGQNINILSSNGSSSSVIYSWTRLF